MSRARITIDAVVPAGFAPGDYALLYGSGGAGEIDHNSPLDTIKYLFFPNGSGLYGFGHAPFGRFRFGRSQARGARGWSRLPFGRFPWGHGAAWIRVSREVAFCGRHKFALASFDALGNRQAASPGEVTLNIHIPPDAPTPLKSKSYDAGTDILLLEVA